MPKARDATDINDTESKSNAQALDSESDPLQTSMKPVLRADQPAIRRFVEEQIEYEIKHGDKLAEFEQTFKSQPVKVPSAFINESPDGMIDVMTSSFGKAVCYEFAADGDPSVAYFKQCPEQGFKLDLD